MRYKRTYIVRVNGIEAARHTGNLGSAYQVATNQACDILAEYEDKELVWMLLRHHIDNMIDR